MSGCGLGHGTKARDPSSAPSQHGQSHPGPSSPPAPPRGSRPAVCRAPPSSGTSASWLGRWRPAKKQTCEYLGDETTQSNLKQCLDPDVLFLVSFSGNDVQPHLTPQEASKTKEDTPQPLLNAQAHATKRFPTKLHNQDLHGEKKKGLRSSTAASMTTGPRLQGFLGSHLYDQSPQHNGAEDRIVEDALEDVPLAVDLAGVQLVKDLHEDEGVEDDGVVLRRRGVEGRVPPTVNVKHLFTCEKKGQTLLNRWLYIKNIQL